MPRSSTSSSASPYVMPLPNSLHLSPLELRNIIETNDDAIEVHEILLNHPHLLARLIHFQALDRSIRRLEKVIQETTEELHMKTTTALFTLRTTGKPL